MMKERIPFRPILLLFGLFWIVGGTLQTVRAQSLAKAEEESRIWLQGRSNLHAFQCEATGFEEKVTLEPPGNSIESVALADHLAIQVRIPVRNLECGKRRMNRDLYQALRSDTHEYITFRYLESRNLPEKGSRPGSILLEVEGVLTVAGTSREIRFLAEGELLDENRIHIEGAKPIRMTDYNVDPPVGLLGLVRAENELTVHFDLYVKAEPALFAVITP